MKLLKIILISVFGFATPLVMFYQGVVINRQHNKMSENELKRVRDSATGAIHLGQTSVNEKILSNENGLLKDEIEHLNQLLIDREPFTPNPSQEYDAMLILIDSFLRKFTEKYANSDNAIRSELDIGIGRIINELQKNNPTTRPPIDMSVFYNRQLADTYIADIDSSINQIEQTLKDLPRIRKNQSIFNTYTKIIKDRIQRLKNLKQ